MFNRRFCRLCLWNDPKLVQLNQEDERNHDNLVHKIEFCLETKVSKDDKHSRYVCPKCVHKIDLFYVFKTNCKRADKLQKLSKDRVPQRGKIGICASNENIQVVGSSEKTLYGVLDEQVNEEYQDPNQTCLSNSPSVWKNPSQDIINTEHSKNPSNNCCYLTGVDHYHDNDEECMLEEEVFPPEDLRHADESVTPLLNNTCPSDNGTSGTETPTSTYADSSGALVAENDENQRNTNNILSNSSCVTSTCASSVYSDEVMWTSSEITHHTVQQQVSNNSSDVSKSDCVAQPFLLNVDWNVLSDYKNGAYNVIYLTGLNENGESTNFLVYTDKVFYTNAILYDAFLHDLPLQTVLEGPTFVPSFSPSFIRCSYCEKLFRCMRSHVLHKSVCQKFFQCRHCRKKFVSKILRQLHYLNECVFRRVRHDHGYAQGQTHKVTEQTLMRMAKVHLHRLHICTKCNNIFRTDGHLIRHKTTCQRRPFHCRSLLRVSRTCESLKCFGSRTLKNLDMYPINNLIKDSYMANVKSISSTTNAESNHCMLRSNNLSVKTRSAVSTQSKTTVKRKDISDSTSVLYAVGLVKKN
ncbi:uncharacterized protein LOC126236196 isoform X1 [Schistocerca nitens]|uniref:uncharacterized protein LOC126236196 isoform X1 n=1 Tax=Schistocerca nitens TaxID=7011 RepID=UPI002117464B|nr:uncharacterized protein LOC126236196 isoform X1 [Schistocerca nitens]